MKHRSVIAYVIVAAALFAAPQLSHDLETFRSALGSRLSVGLMRTFLSLPSAEGAAARTGAPRPADSQLASCPSQRSAARQRKVEPSRAAARASEAPSDELAMLMIEPPPVTGPPHKAPGELAMIIPPGSGVDPKVLTRAAADASAARFDAAQGVRLAEKIRVEYVNTRFEAKGAEWRRADEALRNLETSLPGSYEFRLGPDGSKTRVLKVKRGAGRPCCAPQAPSAPRPAGVDAAAVAPLPAVAVGALATFVGE